MFGFVSAVEGQIYCSLSSLWIRCLPLLIGPTLDMEESGAYNFLESGSKLTLVSRFDRRFRIYDISDYGETIRTYKRTEKDEILDEMVLAGRGAPSPYEGTR